MFHTLDRNFGEIFLRFLGMVSETLGFWSLTCSSNGFELLENRPHNKGLALTLTINASKLDILSLVLIYSTNLWVFISHWYRFGCCFHGRFYVEGVWYIPINCSIIAHSDHCYFYWLVDYFIIYMIPWIYIPFPINHWLLCYMGIPGCAMCSKEYLVTTLYLLMCWNTSMEKW